MLQGTGSDVGKSLLVAGLCRAFTRRGLRVRPFKPQNMSNNAAVTADGGEIGRAQALQARACGVPPSRDMNPVLLKPEGDRRSQVVLMGRPRAVASAREYHELKPRIWTQITSALDRLRAEFDVVVMEGAGSPAEVNLKDHDIVNMRVALHANAPVLLVGDIDRGGIFAQLVGTMVLLEPEERALVCGHVINKFRGDPSLLTSGLEFLHERTEVPVVGVVPYFNDIHVPEEDSVGLGADTETEGDDAIDVAVMRLPHIANFDDFDPLHHEAGVRVRYVGRTAEFGDPDLVVIPGSKTTVADLGWLRAQGLDAQITAARRGGTPIIGICAGYQILGEGLLDPDGVESAVRQSRGLGLLPTTTTFRRDKATHQVRGRVTRDEGLLGNGRGAEVVAYEIHMGETSGADLASPFVLHSRSQKEVELPDGALDSEGLTLGTYLHGLFHNRDVRRSILACAGMRRGLNVVSTEDDIEPNAEYDKLAALVRRHLDMGLVYRTMGLTR